MIETQTVKFCRTVNLQKIDQHLFLLKYGIKVQQEILLKRTDKNYISLGKKTSTKYWVIFRFF